MWRVRHKSQHSRDSLHRAGSSHETGLDQLHATSTNLKEHDTAAKGVDLRHIQLRECNPHLPRKNGPHCGRPPALLRSRTN